MSRHVYPTVYELPMCMPYLDHISVIASAVGYSEFCARGVRREIGAVWLAVGDVVCCTTAHNSVIHPVNAKSCVREQ